MEDVKLKINSRWLISESAKSITLKNSSFGGEIQHIPKSVITHKETKEIDSKLWEEIHIAEWFYRKNNIVKFLLNLIEKEDVVFII